MKFTLNVKAHAALVLPVFILAFAFFAALPYVGSAQVSTSSQQTLRITVEQVITLNLAHATVTIGTLVPGGPVASSTSLTVDTNSVAGWELRVSRDNATTTTLLGLSDGATFPDATAWSSSTPNGQDTTAVGQNLHFKVAQAGTDAALYSSAWWGPNDTDGAGNALYAGFPSISTVIASTTGYVSSTQSVGLIYRADAPATQAAQTSEGTITLTAITKV